MEIRKATESDIDDVHGIAERMLLKNQSHPERSGFLISNFSKEKYTHYLHNAEYFWVIEQDNKVCAFLLAYSSGKIEPSEVVNSALKYHMTSPFILIKQICSNGNVKGAAYLLYSKLFEQMTENYALAAIVNEPLNTRSTEFHRRAGFNHLLDITPPPDYDDEVRVRSIWCYSKSGSVPQTRIATAKREEEVTQLVERAQSVTDLYIHEDNLNWTKLGLLVSFMTALLTAFAVLVEKGTTDTNRFIVVILILFGVLINLLFRNKIKSGLNYFAEHKHNLQRVDEAIRMRTPSIPLLLNKQLRPKSSTSKLLGWLPLVSSMLWVGCSIILLHKFFL